MAHERPEGVTPDELIRLAVEVHEQMDGGDQEEEHYASDKILSWFVPKEVLAAREAAEERAKGWWWA